MWHVAHRGDGSTADPGGSAGDPGDELLIEARHVFGDEQLGSFDCVVTRAGNPVASALVNVYQGAGAAP